MATGYSRVQVRAISEAIEDKVEQEWQRRPLRTEGQAEGTWVLQDYGDDGSHHDAQRAGSIIWKRFGLMLKG